MATGEVFQEDGDEALALVCQEGHAYLILRKDIPDDDLKFLSDWRNANQNQGNSEMQLMVTVNLVCKAELNTSPHVKMSSVISQVSDNSLKRMKSSPFRLVPLDDIPQRNAQRHRQSIDCLGTVLSRAITSVFHFDVRFDRARDFSGLIQEFSWRSDNWKTS